MFRQQDAIGNSILSVGQANISHKEMQGLKCDDIQNKLLTDYNINWNDFSTVEKRGTSCMKFPVKVNGKNNEEIIRNKWILDFDMPIISEDKYYVNMFVLTE